MNNFKKSLLALSLLGNSAFANDVVVDPFVLVPNAVTTVKVYAVLDDEITAETAINAFQARFTLPEGFEFTKKPNFADSPIKILQQYDEDEDAMVNVGQRQAVLNNSQDVFIKAYKLTAPAGKVLLCNLFIKANESVKAGEISVTECRVFTDGDYLTEDAVMNTIGDITINACGYNSFSVCAPVTVSGATVMGAKVNGESLTLSGSGTTVPANTGVILKGEPGATVSFTAAESAEAIDSDLTPYVVETIVVSNSVWALKPLVKEFGLYEGTVVPAQKAVLDASKVPSNGRMRIVEDVTGIESIKAEKALNNYNLMGQQIKSQKGLVIENGKKVIKL